MDEFLSGSKDGYLPWEYEGVSKTARDSFCNDKNQDFLQLKKYYFPHLLRMTMLQMFLTCDREQIFAWPDI